MTFLDPTKIPCVVVCKKCGRVGNIHEISDKAIYNYVCKCGGKIIFLGEC